MASKSSPQSRAKARGRATEQKVAKLLGGHIHTGEDGDVLAYDSARKLYMGEVKYRAGLRSMGELNSFLDQVERYVTTRWAPGQPWALFLTGGREAMHAKLSPSGTFALVPIEEYLRLTGMGKHDDD